MSVDVRVRGLDKAYRDGPRTVAVLRTLDLDVEAGALVAITGPSGAGKSTLLHLLGGLDHPDAGSVSIGGVDLASLDADALAAFRNRTLGFVFQFHRLLPDFTALENVCLPARIAGEAAAAAARRARALLEEVELAARADHLPAELSGGERQRVALCRALVMSPPLLLADEPTGNLDPASASRVLDRLFALRAARGTTTVLVTHNPAIAERCGRVVALKGGPSPASSVP